MKMLLIFVDADHAEDVGTLLDGSGVAGWSEIPTVLGRGSTGRKLGTRAFPGSSTLFFAAVAAADAERVIGDLRRLAADRGPEEGIRVYALDTQEVL
ncbi:MAG: hypothetical protein R3E10_12240 [Gemmatimonadota bacterium]